MALARNRMLTRRIGRPGGTATRVSRVSDTKEMGHSRDEPGLPQSHTRAPQIHGPFSDIFPHLVYSFWPQSPKLETA